MPAADQMNRAHQSLLYRFQSWYASGMLATKALVSGEPLVRVVIAVATCARNWLTDVISATVLAHRSLPPISRVRYSGWSATADCICEFSPAAFAPLTDRLWFRPLIGAPRLSRRR